MMSGTSTFHKKCLWENPGITFFASTISLACLARWYMSISAKTLCKISNGVSTGKCPCRFPDKSCTSAIGAGTLFVLYDRHVLLTIYHLSYYLLFLPPKVLVLLFNEKQSWIIYFSNSGLTIYGLGNWKMPFGRFPVLPAFYNCIYRLDRICRNELAVKTIFLWQRQPHVVTEYILFICIKILTEQRIFLLSTLQIIPFCRKFIA